MKAKILLGLLVLLTFSAIVSAQSVGITLKKTTYKRPKPIQDFKKSFTVTRPIIKAVTPAISKKMQTEISYEKVLNLNIKEEINEIQWLEEATYDINYNKNGLFDITLSLSGTGAYPSVYSKNVVINIKTGNRVTPADVFTNLNGLAAMVGKTQKAEIKKAQEDYKKDPDSADFDGSQYFNDAKFSVKELSEFTISDEGVAFIYDYGFPHVVLALQPDGRYFYTWAQLNPYIKRDGLLARFIR